MPLASVEPSAPDLTGYVTGWLERERLRLGREQERRTDLLARLPDLVECLVARFGVTRVVLFGSLARGEAALESDIDVLVEGLAPARLIDASVEVDRLMKDAHVDIVPASLARPEVRARAESEGRTLYEAERGR